MKLRELGKSGLLVSEVAFGGVEIGMPYGLADNGIQQMPTEEESIHLLHAAIDAGINLFDTAPVYGSSEVIMGKAFRSKRDQVIIETKCRPFRNDQGVIPAHKELRKFIELSLQQSMEALQTSYIDVFMLHEGDVTVLGNQDVGRILTDLKNSGIVRAVGVSTYTTEESQLAIESGTWDVIQAPFNLMDQRQSGLFALALERGVGLIIRSVLFKGLLSNRGKDLHPALKSVEAHLTEYQQLLSPASPELPIAAIKFALSFSEISSVLVGMDKIEYLQKTLLAADGNYYGPEKLNLCKQLAYPDPAFLNLPLWARNGWLK
ncbi:MAG: aldo/keto reductase [Chitinophagaceae bacterium]